MGVQKQPSSQACAILKANLKVEPCQICVVQFAKDQFAKERLPVSDQVLLFVARLKRTIRAAGHHMKKALNVSAP